MTVNRSFKNRGLNSDPIQTYEDASFVTGESPVTLDVETDLNGRKAIGGYVINDGIGNFTVATASSGTNYGDEITVKKNEVLDFEDQIISKVRITWVADSAYRVALV